MIILDEQLMRKRLKNAIAHWYSGQVIDIVTLRPNTVIKDDGIPALLLKSKSPTFVTINVKDFWRRIPVHSKYCIVTIELPQEKYFEVSQLLRELLQMPEFATKKARMGKVIRIRESDIQYYGRDNQVMTYPN